MRELIRRRRAEKAASVAAVLNDRRHQAQLLVEDVQQLLERCRLPIVAGGIEKLLARALASLELGVRVGQKGLQDGHGGAKVWPPRAAGAPTARLRPETRGPRLRDRPVSETCRPSTACPLTISANSVKCTGMTLSSSASPAMAWSRKAFCSCVYVAASSGSWPNERPNSASTLARVQRVEQIHQADVGPFEERHFQVVHEAADRQPEVVTHEEQACTRTPSHWRRASVRGRDRRTRTAIARTDRR